MFGGSIEALCQLQIEEMSSVEVSLYRPARETAVQELGVDRFEEQRQKGAALKMEEVVRLVQDEFFGLTEIAKPAQKLINQFE